MASDILVLPVPAFRSENYRRIPHFKRQALRRVLGEELKILRHETGAQAHNIARETKVGTLTILTLEGARETRGHVTFLSLHRLVRRYGREVSLQLNGKEFSCGADTPLEELISIGVSIDLIVEG